nr:hypothetical protein [Antarcticimicrobium luteum]
MADYDTIKDRFILVSPDEATIHVVSRGAVDEDVHRDIVVTQLGIAQRKKGGGDHVVVGAELQGSGNGRAEQVPHRHVGGDVNGHQQQE